MTTETAASMKLSVNMQAIASALDTTLTGIAGERPAFLLMVGTGKIVQYTSNVDRKDGKDLIEKLLARWNANRADIPAHYNPDLPKPPHPDDVAVDRFAAAMKAKLAEARTKGRSGWENKAECSREHLSELLRDHVRKGDPRDVANFCCFLWNRGEGIAPQEDA